MKKKFLAVMSAVAVFAFTFCGCYNVSITNNNFTDISISTDISTSTDVNTSAGQTAVTRYSKSYYVFGTDASLRIYSSFETEEEKNIALSLGEDVADYLEKLEANTSTSYTTSSVYAFNNADAGAKVEIDEDTYKILSIALDIYGETDGYYNAGVYYNVNIFGFGEGTSFSGTLPDIDVVEAYTQLANAFSDIVLINENNKFYAIKPEKTVTIDDTVYSLKIDLGGIAKGYAADEINVMIQNAGFYYGYINFGSSSMYVKKSATSYDSLWTLTVRNPRSLADNSFMSVCIADTSISTSGDYENYYTIGGVRFAHIINPYTGLPVNVEYSDGNYSQTAGIISATIIGGSAAENDARTTALMAMGLDKAIEYINSADIKSKNLQVYMVYLTSDGKMQLITNVAEGSYTLTDIENFTVASTLDTFGNVTYTG